MRRSLGLGIALACGCFEDPPAKDEPDTDTDSGACSDTEVEGDECRTSLTPVWVTTYGTATAIEGAVSVSARANAIVVAGSLGGTSGDPDLWLELLDSEGESLERVLVGGTANGTDAALAVEFGEDGSIWSTGVVHDLGTQQAEIDTRKLSMTLAMDWVVQDGEDMGFDRGIGIGLAGEGVVVGAIRGLVVNTNAWFGRYDATGTLVEEYDCDCGAVGALFGLATSGTGVRATVVDGIMPVLWGFDGALTAGPTWQIPLAATGVFLPVAATPEGETVVCGSLAIGNDAGLWLARFDASGHEIWTASHDLGDGDQACRDLFIGENDILAVGDIREDEHTARGFVARIDLGTSELVLVEEMIVEESADTRVLAIDVTEDGPVVAGTYAIDAANDDAFVARLVP